MSTTPDSLPALSETRLSEMPDWVRVWIDSARESDDLAQAARYTGYRSPRAALQWVADALSTVQERAERAEQNLQLVRRAGNPLSNLAFNLAQSDALDERTRASLDSARREWDAETVRQLHPTPDHA